MRIYNAVVSCIVSVFFISAAVADDSLWNMSMPTIESPSLGTGFYTPEAVASPFMSGRSGSSASASAVSPASGQASGTAPAGGSGRSVSSSQSAAVTTDTAASSTALSRTLRNSISARDMETMDSLGLLGGLSGLLSEGYGSSLYSRTAATVDKTEETNRLLTRVLEKMEELKEQGEASRSSAEGGAQAILVSDEGGTVSPASASPVAAPDSNSDTHGKSRSRLLRFAVNGYNVLRTCRTVYISDVQDDGTFLVTGDRRYISDGQTRTETFHILFKTKSDTSRLSEYDAATAVTQDSYNPNSFVYQLSKRRNMMASRTGNLVSMRTEDPDWRLELLIDLGE